jgi:phosphoglycerate dehydrogenase-like enzyme
MAETMIEIAVLGEPIWEGVRGELEAIPDINVTYLPYFDTDEQRDYRRDCFAFRQPCQEERLDDALLEALSKAEIVIGVDLPVGLLRLAPRLKWVHSFSAGIDQAYGSGLEDSTSVVFTNQGDLMSPGIAEQCMAGVLALAKRFDHFQATRQQREWRRTQVLNLDGKTLGIFGLGGIGRHVARRAQPFGLRVVGTRRQADKPVPFVDQIYPFEERIEVAAQSDFLVVCAALTPATLGMLGAAEIAAMKPSAYVINVGRGKLIDEEALIKALQSGALAGAHLDCFWTEPNPPENPIWNMPNVIVTPHNAGAQEGMMTKNVTIFLDNLDRYRNSRPLLNVRGPARADSWY